MRLSSAWVFAILLGAAPPIAMPADAPAIEWATEVDPALARAASEAKIVFIDFTAEWCLWCKRLDRETFSDAAVIEFLRSKTVTVRIDADRQAEVARKYKVMGLPTMVFADAKGSEIGRIAGFRPPAEFLEEAGKLTGTALEIAELAKRVESEPKDAASAVSYARKIAGTGKTDEALAILDKAAEGAPNDPAIALARGDILRGAKRYADAAKAYAAVLANPQAGESAAQAALPLALCRLSTGDRDGAAEAAGKAIEGGKEPGEKAHALFIRAYAHTIAKRLDEARKDLVTATQLDPEGQWGLLARSILDRLVDIEEIRKDAPGKAPEKASEKAPAAAPRAGGS